MGKLGRGTGRPNPSCETKFSGANGHREIFNFPRSADHEQDWQPYPIDHTLLNVMTILYIIYGT